METVAMKSVLAQLCSTRTRNRMSRDNDWAKQQRTLVGNFGGVMTEATHRVLRGRNRHRSDEGMHRKPGRSPLAVLD